MSAALLVSVALGVHLALAWPARAAVGSGVYVTLPGATVEERGDRVPGGNRIIPLSAILTFDLGATPPSLIASMPNAVLEGSDAFALTVGSSSGSQLADGTWWFTGDYLADIEPAGTQYLFDWIFSTSTDGRVVWNGITGWAGGHIWQVTISDLTLEPRPWLSVSRMGTGSVVITWSTSFSDYVLEYATGLPAAGWDTVTTTSVATDGRLAVTVDTGASIRFYRLRRP